VSNQSQAALAIINYDGAKTYLPALRKQLDAVVAGATFDVSSDIEVQANWVGLILPYMEQTVAWDRLSGWRNSPSDALFELTLPPLKCKSDVVDGTRISYVVNGGYQNAYGTWSTIVATDFHDPARREDAPFFDYLIDSNGTITEPRDKGPTVSLDYISMHTGTSNMILLSENLQAGEWIYKSSGVNGAEWSSGTTYPAAYGEDRSAFCYPVNNLCENSSDWPASKGLAYLATLTGSSSSGPTYSNPDNDNSVASWKGYDAGFYSDNPFFINVARVPENFTSLTNVTRYNTARPSSNHPGIVIAAFADRGAKPLNENMDKKVFVQICQPSSGAIIKSID
jgi:hypothetical protein